jgi:hypothetical protein
MQPSRNPNSVIDPMAVEKYYANAQFPIAQADLILLARSNGAPQDVLEQMEEMLRSDTFDSLEHVGNELLGAYNDGQVQSAEEDLA